MLLTISSNPSDDRDPGMPGCRDDLKIFLLAAAGVVTFMVIFFYFCHSYDLATGMFFAYALGLLARGKLLQYLGVFALANLNRETTFLLIGIFVVYFFWRLPWRQYLLWTAAQVLLFCLARAGIMALYAVNPGVSAWMDPRQNLEWFLQYPLLSVTHWAAFAALIWLCARRWRNTPRLLQVAFVVMAPVLMVLYLVLGRAFEVRVFAEIYPILWVMLWKA